MKCTTFCVADVFTHSTSSAEQFEIESCAHSAGCSACSCVKSHAGQYLSFRPDVNVLTGLSVYTAVVNEAVIVTDVDVDGSPAMMARLLLV